eukprot:5461912-Pyramimonas_sp.AAC.1
MSPAVEDQQLRNPGRFQSLDIMIATSLEKFNKMRKKHKLPNHHIHFLQQISRMEFGAQAEERLSTGRETIRAICYMCSVRSELGQHRISRDIFKVVIDPNHHDADLHHFYNEWTDAYQQVYGDRPPSGEMRASIHAHFIEQRRQPK